MTDAITIRMTAVEVAQLAALVEQFADLVDLSAEPDPAVERLAPDAYPDDAESSREFRRLTRDDLLSRRAADAGAVLRALRAQGDVPSPADLDEAAAARPVTLDLDADDTRAWMRTLAAVRLVLAERLGIVSDDGPPPADARGFLYEWLGMLLEGIVRALGSEDPLTAS